MGPLDFASQQNSTWPKNMRFKSRRRDRALATSAPNHAPSHRNGGLGEIHFDHFCVPFVHWAFCTVFAARRRFTQSAIRRNYVFFGLHFPTCDVPCRVSPAKLNRAFWHWHFAVPAWTWGFAPWLPKCAHSVPCSTVCTLVLGSHHGPWGNPLRIMPRAPLPELRPKQNRYFPTAQRDKRGTASIFPYDTVRYFASA